MWTTFTMGGNIVYHYPKDRENLSRMLAEGEEHFRKVERRAVDMIEAIINSSIEDAKEGEVN